MRSPSESRAARTQSGLPDAWRHEQLSAAHVDTWRQNGLVNRLTEIGRFLVGDKGPGSKSSGKKPKGGPKLGDKKTR